LTILVRDQDRGREGAPHHLPDVENIFNSKLSGTAIYCTIALLLPIKIMLCSKILM